MQFPKEGWGILVEQLASMQLGVSGCVSSFWGCEALGGGSAVGPDAYRLLGGVWVEKAHVLVRTYYVLDEKCYFHQNILTNVAERGKC